MEITNKLQAMHYIAIWANRYGAKTHYKLAKESMLFCAKISERQQCIRESENYLSAADLLSKAEINATR